MEGLVTLQDAANVVTFVAPGYFAIRTYDAIRSSQEAISLREKEFSRLLIESVMFSLPIVALLHWLWTTVFHISPVSTDALYGLALLFMSTFCGFAAAVVRGKDPFKHTIDSIGLGLKGDFVRLQFMKLRQNDSVTITLKNGEIFSGTPRGGSFYADNEPREYFFDNIAWYNKASGSWQSRPGGVIINLKEIEYIQTP